MNIEERIALYPELSDDERAAVEAYVEAHPEWQPAFDDARRWDDLLRAARALGEDPPGPEALAYYVATREWNFEHAPSGVKAAIRHLSRRIERDADLAKRAQSMASRKTAIESASPAPSHFERLTGHDLNELPSPDAVTGGTPAHAQQGGRTSDASWTFWRAAAAIAALVAVYAVLFAAGHLSRPQHERLASFEDDEVALEGYEIQRGDVRSDESDTSIIRYAEALDQLRRAESSFIGLFPSFDAERLDSAAALLGLVIENEPAESFLSSEAAYLLGKTELARGRLDAAERALMQVVDSGGRRADDARRILSELDR